MIKEAINELNSNGYNMFVEFEIEIKDNKTQMIDKTLYYRTVPEALLYLIATQNGIMPQFRNHFNIFGVMIDLSRNAVFTVSYFKEIIRKYALLGVDTIWLYLEDVYSIDIPYFGYMRGKYTKEEIKEIVKYAKIFQIEIVPAIQTLGHHNNFLRWPASEDYKDQYNVLLAESSKTYELIESMLKTIKDMFETDRIHIGLDETFGLGLGKYYKINGFKDPQKIFIEHLNKVNDMCLKNGFKETLIWSDMLYRLANRTEYYYDTNIKFDRKLMEQIPKNMSLVYWDYYNHDINVVDKMIKSHKRLGRDVFMASGTWIWTRLSYDKQKTDKTALSHIKAAIKNKVDKIIFTQWNDDGAYGDYETVFLGVYEMMVACKLKVKPTNKLFSLITQKNYRQEIIKTQINDSLIRPEGILWDDFCYNIFLKNESLRDKNIIKDTILYYENLHKKLRNKDFKYYRTITEILINKLKIYEELYRNYKTENNFDTLKVLIHKADKQFQTLEKAFSDRWHNCYKPFGLEIIQARLVYQKIRANELLYHIDLYEQKHINSIDFCEEKPQKHQYLSLKFNEIAFSAKNA